VGGTRDGALEIRVRARAHEGKATEEALVALARALDLPRSSVELVSGAASRLKTVEVAGEVSEQRLVELRTRR
jgi:uncharacterized protein YggU (UPF0235/DUF167 family)